MRTAAVLLFGVLLAACGDVDDAGRPAEWVQRADEAFAEGDRLATSPSTLPDAVAAWQQAGRHYVKAFRLEEPLPERAAARAMLAFRVARSWSKSARSGSDEALRASHADRALFWFGQARKLQPAMRHVQFERAVLYDSDIEDVRDPTRAREAYEAYVAAVTEAGSAGGSEAERLTLARERIKALSTPK